MNRCLQETDLPKLMTKESQNLSKKTTKKSCFQQLQTHNMPTDEVENPNGTDERGDIIFGNKPRTVATRER